MKQHRFTSRICATGVLRPFGALPLVATLVIFVSLILPLIIAVKALPAQAGA